MNWTCLVYGGPMFFVGIWWCASAHRWFKGPKVNVEHAIHIRGTDSYAGDLGKIESWGVDGRSLSRSFS